MEQFREFMDLVGTAVDTAGVAIMVIGAFLATGRFLVRRQRDMLGAYRLSAGYGASDSPGSRVPGGW
jgi:hypothetical protein